MPWMHRCPAISMRNHRSQMVLIPDDAEMCGTCGQARHVGRMVAVPASGPGAMVGPSQVSEQPGGAP